MQNLNNIIFHIMGLVWYLLRCHKEASPHKQQKKINFTKKLHEPISHKDIYIF